MLDVIAIKRALISVSDKTGLIELATALTAAGVQLEFSWFQPAQQLNKSRRQAWP